jgi:lysophospholipase L1-like esterase
MKRFALLRAVVPLACAAGLLAPATASAAARKPAKVTKGSTYLALGDSVTFGYLEANTVPAPDYSKASNFLGYPEHLTARLRLKTTNAACPGETAASFVDATAQSNGCENLAGGGAGGYRVANPLHVKYSGSQLDYAVRFLRRHRATRLVSLMIGANDLFLCQQTTPDACGSAAEQTATFTSIRDNVRRIVTAIRRKAGYRGQLVLVHYYALDYASPFVTAISTGLNKAMDDGAKGFKPIVADGFGEFEAASRLSGGHTCQAGLLTQLNGQVASCGVHPTYAGQVLLSQAVEKAIRR